MKRKQKGILAVILILLVGIGIYAYEQHEAAVKKAAAQTLTLSGNVDVREVTLSFRESDRIKEILVEEGDTVEEGQVLARLDTDELNINLRKTKAQIAAQESTVEKLHNGTRTEEIEQARQKLIHQLVCKGALQEILNVCSQVRHNGEIVPLDDIMLRKIWMTYWYTTPMRRITPCI